MFYAFFGHQAFFPSAFVFSVVKEKQFWADHHLTPLQTRKKGKKKKKTFQTTFYAEINGAVILE
jgi:hypothetical protein